MTKREIVSVALKLIGVYVLIQTLGEVSQNIQWVMMFSQHKFSGLTHTQPFVFLTIVSIALWLIMSVVLIAAADAIARALVHDEGAASVISIDGDGYALFALALKVIGVVLLVTAVPNLIETFGHLALRFRAMGETWGASLTDALSKDVFVSQWAAGVHAIVVILIGIGLVWGSSIKQGIRILRERAFPVQPQEEDTSR